MNYAHSSAALLILLTLSLALPVLAQEEPAPPLPPVPPPGSMQQMKRPLDLIRERAQGAQQNINTNAREARIELRQETMIDMRAASSGAEKRAILQQAVGERKEIIRERVASTSALLKMKARTMMHGGQIRNHFSNAIRHLEKFMERIHSRIEKMKLEGVNVATLEQLESDAEAALETLRTDVAAIEAYSSTVTDDTDRAQVKSSLKSLIENAQTSLRTARDAVQKLIKAMVEEAKARTPTSKSTSTTTTQ